MLRTGAIALVLVAAVGSIGGTKVCAQEGQPFGSWPFGRSPLRTGLTLAQADDNPFAAPGEDAPADDDPFGAPPKAAPADDNPFGDGDKPPAVATRNVEKERASVQGTIDRLRSNEEVRSELEAPTRLELIDMPLQDVVDFLADYHGIEIQLDLRALEDQGVGADTPVSRTLTGVPLKSALRLLLEDLDLAYVVRENVLFITTADKAESMPEVRVYDVSKLTDSVAQADEFAEMLVKLFGDAGQPSSGQEASSTIRIVPAGNLLVIRATQQEHDEIAAVFMAIGNALVERG